MNSIAWIYHWRIEPFPLRGTCLFPVLYLDKKCDWQRLVCIFLGTHLGLGGSGLLIRDIFTLSNCSPKWPHQCIFLAMKTSLYSDIFSNTRDPKFLPTERDLKIFNLHILEGLIMFTDHLDHWVFTSFFHFHMIWLYQKHCIQPPKLTFSAGKRKKSGCIRTTPE